jgi:hypothetical protein
MPSATISVNPNPIVPLQPFTADVTVNGLTAGPGDMVTDQQLFVESADGTQTWLLVEDSSSYPMAPGATSDEYVTWQQTFQVPPPTDPAAARALYAIGGIQLAYSLSIDGKPYSVSFGLIVADPGVGPSWWAWSSPTTGTPAQESWKSPYTLAGALTNNSPAQIASGTAVLNEAPVPGGAAVPISQIDVQSTSAGDTFPITFPQVAKQWNWLGFADFVTGPFSEQFSYTVAMTLEDEVGNSYQFTSNPLLVTVTISATKQNDAAGALIATTAGIVAAVGAAAAGIFTFGIAAAVLGALAAGLFGTAASLETQAQDPPTPDPEVLEEVKVVVPVLPGPLADPGNPIGRLFAAMWRVLAARSALSRIEGKLMGAIQNSVAAGIVMQRNSYRNARVELMRGLVALADASIPLQAYVVDSAKLVAAVDEIRTKGLSPSQRSSLVAAGLTDQEIQTFVDLLNVSKVSDSVRGANFERLLRELRARVAYSGYEVLRGTYLVLQ